MRIVEAVFVWIILSFSYVPFAQAQDLLERSRGGDKPPVVSVSEYRGRDRLDLRLSADGTRLLTDDRYGKAKFGVSGALDLDFACGRFDVRANLKHLLGKEAREEFLEGMTDALLAELVHNTLVLVCESSPTVCQALQHYRISANSMLGLQHDWCEAIESAVDDSNQRTRARAIKDCLEEKRAQGKSLPEAREECQSPSKMRGLDGRFVPEIDVVEEIRRIFDLPKVEEDILTKLVSSLRYSPTGGQGDIRANVVLDRHGELVEKYRAAWSRAVDAVAKGQEPTKEEIEALGPERAPKVTPEELAEVGFLPKGRRDVVIRFIASSSALFHLSMEVGTVAKLLDAARKHPTADQDFIRRLEREREDLERHLAEVTRLYELQERHNRTLLEATTLAQTEVVKAGTLNTLKDVQRKAGVELLSKIPRWGAFSEKDKKAGACCDVPRSAPPAPQWGEGGR